MRALRSTRVVSGIAGVQYLTSVVPGSEPAEALRGIQRAVGGPSTPATGEPVPHLFFSDADGGSTGRPPQVIGLWVPIEHQGETEKLLQAAGFVVS